MEDKENLGFVLPADKNIDKLLTNPIKLQIKTSSITSLTN